MRFVKFGFIIHTFYIGLICFLIVDDKKNLSRNEIGMDIGLACKPNNMLANTNPNMTTYSTF